MFNEICIQCKTFIVKLAKHAVLNKASALLEVNVLSTTKPHSSSEADDSDNLHTSISS